MAVWTLVKSAILFPMSELVTIGAEGSSAVLFRDLFEFPEEG